jgi:hypothetical protein
MAGLKGSAPKGGAPKGVKGGPGSKGSKGKGPAIPASPNVTFCVTMSLVDANNLLVAVSSAINALAAKKAKTGGKGGKK